VGEKENSRIYIIRNIIWQEAFGSDSAILSRIGVAKGSQKVAGTK
jgi:hypothetical protein